MKEGLVKEHMLRQEGEFRRSTRAQEHAPAEPMRQGGKPTKSPCRHCAAQERPQITWLECRRSVGRCDHHERQRGIL